jgi:hypothetical protein
LRSTPRIKRLEFADLELQVLELRVSWLLCTARRASPAQALCSSASHGFCHTSQSTKTRSPAIRRNHAGCTKLFSLPKRAQVFELQVFKLQVFELQVLELQIFDLEVSDVKVQAQ